MTSSSQKSANQTSLWDVIPNKDGNKFFKGWFPFRVSNQNVFLSHHHGHARYEIISTSSYCFANAHAKHLLLSFEIQPPSTSPNLFPSMLLHKWSRSSTYFQSHLTQSQVKLVRWWVVCLDKCLQIPKPSFHLSKQTTHHLTRWVFFSSKLTFNWTFPQLNPKLTQT